MKSTVYIQNLRCNGCANTITSTLKEIEGVTEIIVNLGEGFVSFNTINDTTRLNVFTKVKSLGYPPLFDNNTFFSKSKSLISCVRGKI